MPTLTLQDIPDELYDKLKESASANHRSLDEEIIYLLKISLMPRRISSAVLLERARKTRLESQETSFCLDDIQNATKDHRP